MHYLTLLWSLLGGEQGALDTASRAARHLGAAGKRRQLGWHQGGLRCAGGHARHGESVGVRSAPEHELVDDLRVTVQMGAIGEVLDLNGQGGVGAL